MRTVLHSDCNNFYASVECAYDPSLRGKPIAVCGDPEERHGIVLAKSDLAKRYGIRTGETLFSAKQKCPSLVIVPPCGEKYVRFSRIMRGIYGEYSNQVEPFGLDESWLDVSGSLLDGQEIAAQLRKRAKEELGITLSIGVSFNKVFAKLGSDLHKPDATTVISAENYRQKIWPLPAEDLLFIGRSTKERLHAYGLYTIGDIARSDPVTLHNLLGVNGDTLYAYAAGKDETPVLPLDEEDSIKSIGNSTTPAFDIADTPDAQRIIYLLSDSVAERLRRQKLLCRRVTLSLRFTNLHTLTHQMQLPSPTDLSLLIVQAAFQLLAQCWDTRQPLRSLGVQCGDLMGANEVLQACMMQSPALERQATFENLLDTLRGRFGKNALCRASLLKHSAKAEDYSTSTLSAANMAAIHRRDM